MRNTYILMIMQALLITLLFFSEGYVKYTTIGLFLLIDLVIFASLLTRKWDSEELLTFAAVVVSGLFVVLYTLMASMATTVLGITLILLFFVIAMIDLANIPTEKKSDIVMPALPAYAYDVEYEPYFEAKKTPEPVMHVRSKKTPVKDKLLAKAVAYELEREASQLKNAQKLIDEMEVYNTEKELAKEAAELVKVQKQINAINKIQSNAKAKTAETAKKATAAKKASKKAEQLKFLEQQEELIKQGKALARAQKEIDSLQIKTSKKPATVTKVVTTKPAQESFYFATENGNKFHEPGCIALKGIPKNKLILYTAKKDAMKKGLQPCGTCIPR